MSAYLSRLASKASMENLSYLFNIVIAMLVGFLLGALLIAWGGYDPILAYASLVDTSLNVSDPYYIAMTLSFTTPVMLTALTFAVGVRAGLFNIGAEGQVYMGALGAIMVASLKLPPTLYLPLAILVGSLLGGLWGLIAGLFKALRNVNEVVSTIMLNWIAFWIVEYARVYVYFNPLRAEKTISMPPPGRLPIIVPGSELSLSYVISLATVVIVYFIIWNTRLGYNIRVTGISYHAAKYSGANPTLTTLYAFVLGGLVSGLAGVLEICGRPPEYAITTGASNLAGLGFDGIAVSLIGLNHPLLIIPASIVIGMLSAGSRGMQIRAGVPLELVKGVQGLIIISLAVPGFTYMLKRIKLKRSLRGVEGA